MTRYAMRGTARRFGALAFVAALLAGCSTPENSTPLPQLTVPRPTPAEMTEQEPNRAVLDKVDTSCDPTASLRPTSDRAANDEAVAAIRKRGRLVVGLDIGSNLFSFRDPITGELTGFDVDIAGEVSRDIFGTPERVEYRILSSADRVAALKNSTVDIVVKTMTITCARRKEVNFSSVYLMNYQRILTSRDSGITNAQDLSGRRVCAARGTTSLNRLSQITPPPVIMSVVTWADCLVALSHPSI
ncbi:Probable glutamine-binding protein GlnH [Mycobacteroides abscessus]|nr:Probable glutamine-binding protein GlnH [Mycobacteroides abscessus]